MRRLTVLTPAFVLIAACGGGPTEQEENLSERSSGPEQLAGGSPTTEGQQHLGDSGTGGDSVPSQ